MWVVSRRDGEELGRVAQLNEVPSGRLNRFWGDIAYAAAEEAADGVRTVVANAMGAPPAAPEHAARRRARRPAAARGAEHAPRFAGALKAPDQVPSTLRTASKPTDNPPSRSLRSPSVPEARSAAVARARTVASIVATPPPASRPATAKE